MSPEVITQDYGQELPNREMILVDTSVARYPKGTL